MLLEARRRLILRAKWRRRFMDVRFVRGADASGAHYITSRHYICGVRVSRGTYWGLMRLLGHRDPAKD